MRLSSLYERPVATATGLLIVLVLSGALLSGARLGPSADAGGAAFTVIVEHYGVDAAEIERTITRPLEDALGSLPGLKSLRSLSDYGSSRVTALTQPGVSEREISLQLRDAVDRLYGQLPGSVQRPRIVSSAAEGRAFFIASVRSRSMNVTDLATLLERELKPSLEKIEGAGEVEIGGGSPREIHVVVDPQRAARGGVDAASIAQAIQSSEVLAPLGVARAQGYERAVVLRGRLGNLDALRVVRVPVGAAPTAAGGGGGAAGSDGSAGATGSATTTLGSLAVVAYAPRERDEVSRVDGVENAVIALKSAGGANLLELSRAIHGELGKWKKRGLEFSIILDTGAELRESLDSILEAILFAVLVSALTLPLFLSGLRRVAVISVSIPVIGLAAAAAISAVGLSLDTYILSGLAVGMGTMIDTGIILAGRAPPDAVRSSYFRDVDRLIPALLSSCLTALIVLLPLVTLELGGGGIREVSLALAALMAISFVLSCLFIPPYVMGYSRRLAGPTGQARHPACITSARRYARSLARSIITRCASTSRWPLIGGVLVAVAGVWAVTTIGIDLDPPAQADSIPVHVECESGASYESVDTRTVAFSRRIRAFTGVTVVQSTARRGSAEVEVGFDPARVTREALSARIRDAGRDIPGGFAYLTEGAGASERQLEIAITGEDDRALKAYAVQAARLLGQQRAVREVVLNFKEPADTYAFRVDLDKAAAVGADAAAVAGALRWHLYGPVALKWIGEDREMDLRIMGRTGSPTLDELSKTPVSVGSARSVPALAAGSFVTLREGGKLHRLNRQRAVYLTVHVPAGDIRTIVRDVEQTLGTIALAPGYTFDVGRDLVEQAGRFQKLWVTFAVCIVLVYLVLGVLTESASWPLVILAVLPSSVMLPLIIMRVAGQRLVVPVLIGLIVLSGMAVNNSILIVDAYRARRTRGPGAIADAVLSRLGALTATSGATVLGHLPLLFAAGDGAAFMRSLAFVIIWGIVGSYAATVLLVPPLIAVAAGMKRRISDVRRSPPPRPSVGSSPPTPVPSVEYHPPYS